MARESSPPPGMEPSEQRTARLAQTPNAPHAARDGRVVGGRYELLEPLGEGGAARVFRAHDRVLDRIVAVKVLRVEYGTDPEFVARFQQEARAVAALSHPNLVAVYDFGAFADTYFIAMEYVEGTDLKAILRREGQLQPTRAVAIVSGILRGLAVAHEHGLIHRDVKPQNVLVRAGDGQVKLTDFGVARAIGAVQHTAAGTTFGTPHYMAPEQATGGQIGPTADLYAAAVILFEALAGRLPFEGETALAVTAQHIHAPVPPLMAFAPQVPPALARVVERALSKDPAARYQHAEALRRAIAAAVGDHSGATVARGVPTRVLPKPVAAAESAAVPAPAVAPVAVGPVATGGAPRARVGGIGCLLPLLSVAIVALSIALFVLVRGEFGSSPPTATPVAGAIPSRSGAVAVVPVITPTAVPPTLPPTVIPPTLTIPPVAIAEPTQQPTVATTPTVIVAPPTATTAPPTATVVPPTPTRLPPTAAPTQPPTAAATKPQSTATAAAGDAFSPYQLQGAYRRDDGVLYGLSTVALYGQESGYSEGALTFQVAQLPGGKIRLVLTGLDDERAEHCQLQVVINGVTVFDGPNTFPNVPNGDTGIGGSARYWGQMTIAVPDGVLQQGRNTLSLRNRTPGAKPGIPYILIHDLLFVGD